MDGNENNWHSSQASTSAIAKGKLILLDNESLESFRDGPPLLGLVLRRTPSFMDRIDSLSTIGPQPETCDDDGEFKCNKAKVKASNFPVSLLTIGTYQMASDKNDGELVGKIYYAKRIVNWEILQSESQRKLKVKIEFKWEDISGITAMFRPEMTDILQIELSQRPHFYKELDPIPRKHTQWAKCDDFTSDQAGSCRIHHLECRPGILKKHYDKLLQCDPRLLALSRGPFPSCENPFFDMILEGQQGQHHQIIRQRLPIPLGSYQDCGINAQSQCNIFARGNPPLHYAQPVPRNNGGILEGQGSVVYRPYSNSFQPAHTVRSSFVHIGPASPSSYTGNGQIVQNGVGQGHLQSNDSLVWDNGNHNPTNFTEQPWLPPHGQLAGTSNTQMYRPMHQHEQYAIVPYGDHHALQRHDANSYSSVVVDDHEPHHDINYPAEVVLPHEQYATVPYGDHHALQRHDANSYSWAVVNDHKPHHDMNYPYNLQQQAMELASDHGQQNGMTSSCHIQQQPSMLDEDHKLHHDINYHFNLQQQAMELASSHGQQNDMNSSCHLQQQSSQLVDGDELLHDLQSSSGLQQHSMVLAGDHGLQHNINSSCHVQQHPTELFDEDAVFQDMLSSFNLQQHVHPGLQDTMNFTCNLPSEELQSQLLEDMMQNTDEPSEIAYNWDEMENFQGSPARTNSLVHVQQLSHEPDQFAHPRTLAEALVAYQGVVLPPSREDSNQAVRSHSKTPSPRRERQGL